MDAEQFEKLHASINRLAAATLATAVIGSMTKKPTLKEVQDAFNDCFMIVNPTPGTTQQDAFQQRLDKREW
jgi:hypothetical protein